MTTSHPNLVWVSPERLVRSRDMSEVAELVRAAAEGDQAAWNGLVDRYNGLVWSVARSHRLATADASDVVQTTWLRLVENLGRLQDPDRVGAWLATTARCGRPSGGSPSAARPCCGSWSRTRRPATRT